MRAEPIERTAREQPNTNYDSRITIARILFVVPPAEVVFIRRPKKSRPLKHRFHFIMLYVWAKYLAQR